MLAHYLSSVLPLKTPEVGYQNQNKAKLLKKSLFFDVDFEKRTIILTDRNHCLYACYLK